MKPLILSIILAFTITHATAQSITCRPVGTNTVCTPTPTSTASLGSALATVLVLYLIISWLNSPKEQKTEHTDE